VPWLRRHKSPLQEALNALARAERARSASSLAGGLAALGAVRQQPGPDLGHQPDVVDRDHDGPVGVRPGDMSVLGSTSRVRPARCPGPGMPMARPAHPELRPCLASPAAGQGVGLPSRSSE
jgi:hypothetical protein